MALSDDREVLFYTSPELIELPVDDDVVIYKGALVGRNRTTGLARGLVAGDDFLGVAYRRADNTGPGHAPGAVRVRLHQMIDIVHALPGVGDADIGRSVYASDDETLTLDPQGASRVGRVVAVEGTDLARVRCQPVAALSGMLENTPVIQLPDADATLTLDHIGRTLLMANTAARLVTLPPVAQVRAGGRLRVIKTSSAAFPIVLDGNGAETIDGTASFTGIDAQFDTVELLCTGTQWVIVNRDLA